MNIDVTVEDVTLQTIVREATDYSDPLTLADKVADRIVSGLANDDEYGTFTRRVMAIRDEEIRAAVQPLITEALIRPFDKTNTYGEPIAGSATTLSEIIVSEAKSLLTKPLDSYNRDKGTVVSKMIAEEVHKALGAEIADAVKQARAAVADQIGTQIAAAVKAGLR